MISRYYKYNFVIQSFLTSKSHIYFKPALVKINYVSFSIEHLKLNNLYSEHGLIFLGLSGQNPSLDFFVHGKRLQKTVSLNTSFYTENNIFSFVDRFISIILPSMHDLRVIKLKRHKGGLYTWHLKKYFEWDEVDGFISDRLITKPFIVPLVLQLQLNGYYLNTENFLRMLRFPFIFYKYNTPKLASDLY